MRISENDVLRRARAVARVAPLVWILLGLGCGQGREASVSKEGARVEPSAESGPGSDTPGADTAPSDCAFAVGASCFASLDAACAALGCPRKVCSATYSLPSEVTCDR